jgi:hypothetical protein
MKPLSLDFAGRIILLAIAGVLSFTCGPIAFAQHGGGHAGGGHFGGVGHAGTPHVSPPAVAPPHVAISRPIVSSVPPPAGAGTRTFVVVPPTVHLSPPAGTNRPILGGRVMMPPVLPPQGEPHTTIGFPRTGVPGRGAPLRFSPVLSFSGQGHEIWQDAAGEGRGSRVLGGTIPQAGRPEPSHFPRRPRFPFRPVFPIFGPPGFGFFGSPFFGLGLGFGFNSVWWPSCGPYWGWGYGCNALPYYGYGPGYGYGSGYSSSNLEAQAENQSGPQIYESPSATSPIFVYGEEGRELVQLYLRDGTIYNVTDYWLVNDQLHCTTVEGNGTKAEHVIDFDQLDLQKTIDVNTARGFRFVLRNEPLEQYLQDHPDAGSSNAPPLTGPTGPLQPPPPPQPAQPRQPSVPPQP